MSQGLLRWRLSCVCHGCPGGDKGIRKTLEKCFRVCSSGPVLALPVMDVLPRAGHTHAGTGHNSRPRAATPRSGSFGSTGESRGKDKTPDTCDAEEEVTRALSTIARLSGFAAQRGPALCDKEGSGGQDLEPGISDGQGACGWGLHERKGMNLEAGGWWERAGESGRNSAEQSEDQEIELERRVAGEVRAALNAGRAVGLDFALMPDSDATLSVSTLDKY